MKKSYQIAFLLVSFFFFSTATSTLHAQAFRKGCLLLSISEGSTTAKYSTTNHNAAGNTEAMATQIHMADMDGVRDPLFLEFGLSNRWGIGLSSGNDLFTLNPQTYYGFKRSDGKSITAKTSEFTFDINYHFYTRKKVDLSVYTSLGSFGVAFSGKDGETAYNYNSKGGIVRAGIKARYYFWKRLGVMGMISTYSADASTDGLKGITVGNNTSTSIKGTALEFGLCFRFF